MFLVGLFLVGVAVGGVAEFERANNKKVTVIGWSQKRSHKMSQT